MKIIALAGKLGAGKDTFAIIATKHFPPEVKIAIGSFSNILKDVLKAEGREASRENLQSLGASINRATLIEEQHKRIKASRADIFFIPGMRTSEDVDFLKSLGGILIAVHSNDPATRYQRIKNRQQKPGEKETSWEGFLQQESHPIESKIDEIMRMADYHVENNGTPEEFEEKVVALIKELD